MSDPKEPIEELPPITNSDGELGDNDEEGGPGHSGPPTPPPPPPPGG